MFRKEEFMEFIRFLISSYYRHWRDPYFIRRAKKGDYIPLAKRCCRADVKCVDHPEIGVLLSEEELLQLVKTKKYIADKKTTIQKFKDWFIDKKNESEKRKFWKWFENIEQSLH